MLCRDYNGINIYRLAVFIFNSNLCLAIWSQISEFPIFSDFCQSAGKSVSQSNRHRKVFRCFIGSIAEHHSLIASADIILVSLGLFCFKRFINAHSDIRRLFINGNVDADTISIKAIMCICITDFTNRISYNFRNRYIGRCCDFTKDMYLSSRNRRFTSNSAIRILFQDCVKNCIRNLIGNFIRMSFCYRFRSK